MIAAGFLGIVVAQFFDFLWSDYAFNGDLDRKRPLIVSFLAGWKKIGNQRQKNPPRLGSKS